LQRVIGALSLHVTMSKATKFVINKRRQFSEGGMISIAPVSE
jgi:hypothetical protein